MHQPFITCHYHLTRDEYLDIQLYVRRRALWWRGGGFGALILMFIAGTVTHGDDPFRDALVKWKEGDFLGALNIIFPLLILAGVCIFAASRILPVRALCSMARLKREPELVNQKRVILIDEKGIHAENGESMFDQAWDVYSCVRESKSAFAFHYRGLSSILWLPKHGFDTPEDINRFRTLIQERVKDFRRLG